MIDSIGDGIGTTGRITAGSSVTGEIETANDRDAYAVELVAGRTYRIDLEGVATDKGTLADPLLRWLRDDTGTGVAGTRDDNGGEGDNARQTFTPAESGTYYISARGLGDGVGTYTLTVTDATPVTDATRAGAADLGDITALQGPRFPQGTLDGDTDQVDYYRFTLTEAKQVGLGLRQQDANADLYLEDADGTVLHSSTNDGTANEAITETLLAGTYYVRVESQEAGLNAHVVRYGVSAPDANAVAALQEQSGTAVNAAPAFAETSYAFDLAENADGSTDRVSLGTVAATDPEGATLSYTLVGGNGSFEVDATSGELFYTGTGEDFESETTRFFMAVRASDGSLHAYTSVVVNVTDVNETPAFAETSYAFDLAENADGSTDRVSLGTVAATDPEGETLAYALVGGNLSGSFELDETTGELFYIGSGEDFESGLNRFTLTVWASDGSETAETTVTVDVTDVNETPAFAETSYAFDLAEDTDGSTDRVSLGTVAATDPEGTTLAYRLAGGNESGSFEVDATSGELFYTGSGEDFESGTTQFTLTVRASDGSESADTTVTINVTDVDETPSFVDASYTFNLAENADGSTNRVSLGTVAATDPEGTTLAYSLVGGNESGSFEVDATSGELFYKGSGEDFESGTTQFTLTVRASDGSESADTTVTVDVTDVDDTPAIRVADAEATEGDDTEMVFRVTLDNASTGTVTVNYATTDGTATAGEDYTATSGTLTFAPGETEKTVSVAITDDEVEDSGETFTLVLSDPSGGQLGNTQATGTIRNTETADVNETPSFAETSYAFDLAENADGSTNRVALGTVAATDPDRTTLIYRVVGGNESGSFEIGAVSGKLFYIGSGEDFESGTTQFTLTVRASDGSETADTTVTVNVTDVEETVDPPAADEDETALPTVSEPEGEDFSANTSTSGRVAVGETATGNIGSNDDRDWFAVELVAGRTYTIDLRGGPSGDGTHADLYLYGIHDADGNLIEDTTNDDGGRGFNSRVTFTPTATGTHHIAAGAHRSPEGNTRQGTYELEVTDDSAAEEDDDSAASNGGNNGDDYTANSRTTGVLTVGESITGEIETVGDRDWIAVRLESPLPSDAFWIRLEGLDTGDGTLPDPYIRAVYEYRPPSASHDGEELFKYPEAHDNDGGTLRNSFLEFEPDFDGYVHFIEVTGRGSSVGTYKLTVVKAPDDHPSDTSTLGSVAVGGSARGNIERGYDTDWFAVDLVAGTTYRIDLSGNETGKGSLRDPYLYGIHDAEGNLVPNTSDDDGGPIHDSRLEFTPDATGTYYISAGAYGITWPGTGTYTLSVVEATDDHPADATTLGTVAVGGSASGHVEKHGDVDWYSVTLVGGTTYRIDLEGRAAGGGTLRDPHLRGIYDADGNPVPGASDDDGGVGLDSRMEFTPENSGTYYLAAGGEEATGDRWPTTVGTYTLSVVEATDDYPSDAVGALEVGGSATGHIEKEGDYDWFGVTLEAGKTYLIDLKGSSTGDGTLPAPFIANIWSGPAWASVPNFTNYAGSGKGDNSRVVLTPETDGTYYINAQGLNGAFVGTYTLTVNETVDDYSADTSTTGVVAVGGSARGEIEIGHDRDWFAVTLEGGTTYQVEVRAMFSGRGTLRDPYLRGIHDSAGTLLAGTENNDYGDGFHFGGFRNPNYPVTWDSRVDFTPEEDGTYYVAAGAWDDLYGTYTVSVSEAEDTL